MIRSRFVPALERFGSFLTGQRSLFDPARRRTEFDRLSEILPYRLHDDKYSLFVNARSTGWIMEIVPLQGADDNIRNVLAEVLSDGVPDKAYLQIINWASPSIGHVIRGWAEARGSQSEIVRRMAAHRADHLYGGAFDSLSSHAPFHVRRFQVLIAVGIEGELDATAREELAAVRDSFFQAFKSLNIPVRKVGPKGLIRFCREVLNPCHSAVFPEVVYDPAELIDRQIVRADTSVTIEPDRMLFDTVSPADVPLTAPELPVVADYRQDRFDVRAFSARRFPEQFHQAQMGAAIGDMFNDQLRFPCPVLSCLTVSFESREAMGALVGLKFARAQQLAGTGTVRYVPEILEKAADWKWVRDQLTKGKRLVKGNYFSMVFAPLGKADMAERSLRSVYRSIGWEMQRDKYLGIQTLAACLPLTLADGLGHDLKVMHRQRFLLSDSCVNLAPMQGESVGGPRPDMLLLGRRGSPFYWSPFENAGEGNHNVAIIGASGSGKSVFMQDLATSIFGAGGHVTIIDDGESFLHTCRLLGGEHMAFTLKSEVSLNPFAMVDEKEAEKDPDYLADSLTLVRAILVQMCKGDEIANADERGHVDAAVSEVWARSKSTACIDDVEAILTAAGREDLAGGLKPYTGRGVYRAFFDGPQPPRLDNRLTVFEMKNLEAKPELRSVVLLALMFIINQRMTRDRRERGALFVDEAWQMLGSGAAGEFIAGFARRCRKYGGALVTGTQSLDDYYRSDGARAALENSDWLVSLRVKAENLAALRTNKRLAIDSWTARLIESLSVSSGEYSECMIKGPYGCQVGRLALDSLSSVLYSSDAVIFAEIEQLVDRGLSLSAAIEQVAARGKTGLRVVAAEEGQTGAIERAA